MRRKCKQFIAMFLAVSTVLTGCASDLGFYADEIPSESVAGSEIVVDGDSSDVIIESSSEEIPSEEPSNEIEDPSDETETPSTEEVDPSNEVPSESVDGTSNPPESEDLSVPVEPTEPSESLDPSVSSGDNETLPSEEDPSKEDARDLVCDGSFSITEESDALYVQVGVGGSVVLSGDGSVISISRDSEEHATVTVNGTEHQVHIHNSGLFKLGCFSAESTVTVETTTLNGYRVDQYAVSTDTGDVLEEKTDFSDSKYSYSGSFQMSNGLNVSVSFSVEELYDLYVNVKGLGVASFVKDEDYFWFSVTEGGIEVTDAQANPIDVPLSPEGYYYLGSYVEGSVFDLGIAYEGEESVSYVLKDAEGNEVKSETGYAYLVTDLALSQTSYIDITLGNVEEDMSWLEPAINWDWRASTEERGIYHFGEEEVNDPETGMSKVYWGETIVELIAMYNEGVISQDIDWGRFFETTIYYGTDYNGLLFLYKNGYNFEDLVFNCLEEGKCNIWDYINGNNDYETGLYSQSNLGAWGLVSLTENRYAIIPDIYGNYNSHKVLGMRIYTRHDREGEEAFCIDPRKPMPNGSLVYVVDECGTDKQDSFRSLSLGWELHIRESIGGYQGASVYGYVTYVGTRIRLWSLYGDPYVQDTFLNSYADFFASSLEGKSAEWLQSDTWRNSDSLKSILRKRASENRKVGTDDPWAMAYYAAYKWSVIKNYAWPHGIYMWTTSGTTSSSNQRLISWMVPWTTETPPPTTTPPQNKGDGTITAVKRGTDGSLYAGATFAVLNSSLKVIGTITTDESGTGSLTVTPGTYYVREVTPPAGCELVDTLFKCTVSAATGYSAEITAEDPPLIRYGWLKLRKTNNYGVLIGDCIFGVYSDGGCTNQVATMTSSARDIVQVELEEGTYYVKEISAPERYELDTNVYTAIIDGSTNYEYTVSAINTLNRVEFGVRKIDAETGEDKTNTGAWFQILDRQYNIILAEVHDFGYVLLAPGEYICREIYAPPGYGLAEDVFFELTEADRQKKITVSMYDSPNEYTFLKLHADTGLPVAGAVLGLYDEFGVQYEQWTTDGTPHVIKRLPAGRYTLRELTAPAGFVRAESVTFTVEPNKATHETITMYNSPRTLSIYKVDTKTGEGLSGAMLELWKVDANENPVELIDSWESDGTPHIVSGVTTDTKYAVIETKAPEGYVLTPKTIIVFGHQHTASCYVRHVHTDDCKGYSGCSDYCGGIDETGNWNDDPRGLGWCPNCGRAEGEVGCEGSKLINCSWCGNEYSNNCVHIPETSIVCGKDEVDELICPLQEGDGGNQVYYIYNSKEPTVENVITVNVVKVGPTKTDIYANSKLAGAHLQILNASGTVVKDWVSTTEGMLFTDLPAGNYVLREVDPPAGYLKAPDQSFTVRNTTTTQTVTMTDDITKLLVKKVTLSGENISGAHLQILDANGVVFDDWWTLGRDHITYGIPVGNYVLHEVSAPYGYRIAEDVPFTIQPVSTVQEVTMIDTPLKLAIDKVDITTGKSLIGAQLQLWSTVGNDGVTKREIYASWTSTGQPYVLTAVPVGKYIVVEVAPPNGYVRAETVIEVTGNCNAVINNQDVELIKVNNDYIKLDVNKTDIHTGYALPGCELYLWYADETGKSIGRLADTWVSDGKPHRIDRLPEGWYRLEEVEAATGYSVADPLIFYVEEKTAVQTYTMEDDYLFVGFELSKVDGITGEFIGDKADDYGDESIAQFELWEYNNQLGDYEISKDYKIVYTGKGHYSVVTTIDWAKDGFLYWRPDTPNRPGNSGLFKYREVKAPYGYELNDEFVYIDVIKCQTLEDDWTVVREDPNGGKPWVAYLAHNESYEDYQILDNTVFANEESRGTFEIIKWDTDRAESDLENIPQGDSSLAGFEFTIYNRGVRPIWYYPNGLPTKDYSGNITDRVLVNVGDPVCTIVTDEFGSASTAILGLPYGTYEAIETKQGEGFMHETNNSEDRVGSITFTIDKWRDHVVADFDGTYGFPRQDDQIIGQKYIKNDVIRGGVQIQKWDVELNKSEAIGGKDHGNNDKGTHLEGITFDIKNVSNKHIEYDYIEKVVSTYNEETGMWVEEYVYEPDPSTAREVGSPVYVEGVWYDYGTVVKSITTHWNEEMGCYTAETGTDTLPYGTYEIYEVATTDSYLLNDEIHTFQIREDGVIVTKDVDGELIVTRDQVVRGDVRFVKIEEETHRFMKVPFLVTNLTTGEQHIIVTDTNGQYNSASTINDVTNRLHSFNTNNNDWLIDLAKEEGYIIQTDDLDSTSGTWFGLAEDGSIAEPNDELHAFPFGSYRFTELRSNNNEGLVLQEFIVHIYNFDTENYNAANVDIGTVINSEDELPLNVQTSALDSETKTHSSNPYLNNGIVTLTDRVDLTGIVSGGGYRVVGRLMDNEWEDTPIIQNKKYIEDEVWFRADAGSASVDLNFTFDCTEFIGKKVVVYVEVYRAEYENDKRKDELISGYLGQGKDNDNIAETIWFVPNISTSLKDALTGDNVAVAESANGSKLIDTVSYSNLAPNLAGCLDERFTETTPKQHYIMSGTLYDVTAGNTVAATSSVDFVPDDSGTGTVEVPFEFKGIDGHTYVAVERLLAPNGKVIASHIDLEDPAQTVYIPKVETNATDPVTGNHVGVVGGTQTIEDIVTYSNLVVGNTYTVTGTLMVKETGEPLKDKNGNVITSSDTFVATETSGSRLLTFEVETDLLYNQTVVAFEKLSYKGIDVAAHEDINDEDQSAHYPDVHTTAIDGCTIDDVATAHKTFVTDTVAYENLVIGQEYTISGILMDAETGEYLGKDRGLQPIMATTTFTAPAEDGEIKMIFKVDDGDLLQGKTCVVFENLLVNGVVVRHHEDLTDKAQTVYFPKVETEAIADTGLKEQLAEGEQIIHDSVTLSNLVIGREYRIDGVLYDKSTGFELIVKGELVTASKTFVAVETTEVHVLDFVIKDASVLQGTTVVAFEDLYHKNVNVASHHDIDDFDQSIKYPKVETSAFDADTLLDEGVADEDTSLVDTVTYTNLESEATYTVKGTIYSKETGGPQEFEKGYIIASTTFVALSGSAEVISTSLNYVSSIEELNAELNGVDSTTTELGNCNSEAVVSGTVEIRFNNFNAKDLLGKTVVAFEYLLRDNVLVGKHTDIDDEEQDVKYPKTTTVAIDATTGIQEVDYGSATVVDEVTFENLTPGNTYTLVTTAVNKDTGEVVVSGGVEARVETEFTAVKANETRSVQLTFGTLQLEGETVVIFERLYREGKLVSVHTDLDDEKQSLYFPSVSTNAKDSVTGDHEGYATEGSVLIDEVTYDNLTYGESYRVEGIIYDKSTGKPFLVDGEQVTAELLFLAGVGEFDYINNPVDSQYTQNTYGSESRPQIVGTERANGMVTMTFTFDATTAAGKDLVVFEKLYTWDGKLVGHHTDIEDEDQTVSYPKVETEMTDSITKDHESQARENTTYIDTVTCSNLTVGNTYTLHGILMDKETGEALLIDGETVTATKEFTATERNMVVEMEYTFDSSAIEGKDVVSFEELKRNDITVGTHTDIEDDSQTVAVINIHTTAVDDVTKLHEGLASETAVIRDTVQYVNLFYPGTEYVLKGTLVDKSTGEVIPLAGTENVTVTKSFIADGRTNTVDLEFTVNTSELKNKDIVVYERLYKNGVEIATHCDLEDASQTVHIPEIGTTVWDTETKVNEGYANENSVIVDTIEYKNLTKGEKYTAHAVVVDKETGEPIPGYEAYKSFVAGNLNIFGQIWDMIKDLFGNEDASKRVDGSVDIDIPFDTTAMAGKDVVVFEYVYRVDFKDDISEDKLVAEHEDINDEKQTMSFPKIETQMLDRVNNTHISQPGVISKYVDTVGYTNLTVGKTYVVSGILMNKETNEPLLVNGEEIHGKTEFTPTEPNGYVEVVYELDTSELEGKDVVSFETLTRDDVVVGTHTDITDESQTIAVANVHTVARDAVTGSHESLGSKTTKWIDRCEYVNLIVGNTYRMSGSLVNKDTGELIAIEGATSDVVFTPTERDGYVDVEFNIDASVLTNMNIVIFEELYLVSGDEESRIINVCDLNDTNETMYVPSVSTKACDVETGENEGLASGMSTIVDKVEIKNITYGETYVIKGILYSKSTGQPIVENGNYITASKVFTAVPKGTVSGGDAEVEIDFSVRYNCEEELTFVFNSSSYEGQDIVVFEYLYRADSEDEATEETKVGEHTDIEDEDQTVSYPEVKTTLTKEGNHSFKASGTVKVVDRIVYKNLTAGNKYTAVGTLYDKETATSTGITSKIEFVATETDGYVDLVFEFDSNSYIGKKLVAFEKVYNANGILIGEHEDINDEDQTVEVNKPDEPNNDDDDDRIKLWTTATNKAGDSKVLKAGKYVVLADRVFYENLNPGEMYSVIGKVVDKETGKVLVEKVVDFVPEERNGSVVVEFTLNTLNLKGKSLVVFEYLHQNGGEIARHEDINDEDQTVVVTSTMIETGDPFFWLVSLGAVLVALGALVVVITGKKRKKEDTPNE